MMRGHVKGQEKAQREYKEGEEEIRRRPRRRGMIGRGRMKRGKVKTRRMKRGKVQNEG
jgi:hypothetical protein